MNMVIIGLKLCHKLLHEFRSILVALIIIILLSLSLSLSLSHSLTHTHTFNAQLHEYHIKKLTS